MQSNRQAGYCTQLNHGVRVYGIQLNQECRLSLCGQTQSLQKGSHQVLNFWGHIGRQTIWAYTVTFIHGPGGTALPQSMRLRSWVPTLSVTLTNYCTRCFLCSQNEDLGICIQSIMIQGFLLCLFIWKQESLALRLRRKFRQKRKRNNLTSKPVLHKFKFCGKYLKLLKVLKPYIQFIIPHYKQFCIYKFSLS